MEFAARPVRVWECEVTSVEFSVVELPYPPSVVPYSTLVVPTALVVQETVALIVVIPEEEMLEIVREPGVIVGSVWVEVSPLLPTVKVLLTDDDTFPASSFALTSNV